MKRAAIQVIDETLTKRGEISLIKGQPLLIATASSDIPPTRKKVKRSEVVSNDANTGTTARVSVNPSGQTSSFKWTDNMTGSSMRALASAQGVPSKKNINNSNSTFRCVRCGSSAHEPNQCPVAGFRGNCFLSRLSSDNDAFP
jgi:ribosomal protein L37E